MSGSESVSIDSAESSESAELSVKSESLPREHGYMVWQLDRAGRELKQAFNLFIAEYKKIPSEGSWFSSAAWTSTMDLHGHRARQTEALEALQALLEARLTPESQGYGFLYYLIAFELVSTLHQLITQGIGHTFKECFDTYEASIKTSLERLSLEEDAKVFQRVLKSHIQKSIPQKFIKHQKEGRAPILSPSSSSDLLMGAPMLLEWVENLLEWLNPPSRVSHLGFPRTIESSCGRLLSKLEKIFPYQALLDRWVPMAMEANKKYPIFPSVLFFEAARVTEARVHESEAEKAQAWFEDYQHSPEYFKIFLKTFSDRVGEVDRDTLVNFELMDALQKEVHLSLEKLFCRNYLAQSRETLRVSDGPK